MMWRHDFVGAGLRPALAPQERLANVETLHELLATSAIDVVTLPPSVLALLEPEGLARLRTVCAAGEACSWQVAARWAAISGQVVCPVFCCPRDIGTPPGDGERPWFRP